MIKQNQIQFRSLLSFTCVVLVLVVLSLASCEKEDKFASLDKATSAINQAEISDSSLLYTPIVIDESLGDNSNSYMKAASTCSYSSPIGQCTAGVRLDKGGYIKGNYVYCGVQWSGNACDWYKNAKAKGYKVGSTPKVGAIIVWPSYKGSSYGHVGVITEYKKGCWYYKAMNDYPNGLGKWSYRLVKEFPNRSNPVAPLGYIYTW